MGGSLVRRNTISFQQLMVNPSLQRPGEIQVPRPGPAGTAMWPIGALPAGFYIWPGQGPLGSTGGGPLGSSGGGPLGTTGGSPLGWTDSGALGNGWPIRKKVGMGYHPDLPDARDKGASHLTDEVRVFLSTQTNGAGSFLLGTSGTLPSRFHLGDKVVMPPVEDQGTLNSCTANAVIGLVEFLIKISCSDDLDLSRLFLYWTTRRLLGWTGDTGAYIRTTIKAMVLFGVPPENDWPYLAELLDRDPDAYLYAYAQNFKAMKYARLDEYGKRGTETLIDIKKTICDGFPIAFGFPVYRSIECMGPNFIIPLPVTPSDKLVGGHAVLAVGYNDAIHCPHQDEPGALIIKNSWGPLWGDMGYGYLPYDYVRKEMALDFWTIFHQEWVNPEQFG